MPSYQAGHELRSSRISWGLAGRPRTCALVQRYATMAAASAKMVVAKAPESPGMTFCPSSFARASIWPCRPWRAALNPPMDEAMPLAVPMKPSTGRIQAYTFKGV